MTRPNRSAPVAVAVADGLDVPVLGEPAALGTGVVGGEGDAAIEQPASKSVPSAAAARLINS